MGWGASSAGVGGASGSYTLPTLESDLSGLTYATIDMTSATWAAGGGGGIVGATLTKTNAGTFGGQAFDCVITVLEALDTGDLGDWVNNASNSSGADGSGMWTSGANAVLNTDIRDSATADSGWDGLTATLEFQVEIFETGTATPLPINAIITFRDIISYEGAGTQKNILFVVGDKTTPTTGEAALKTLLEDVSRGHTVTYINDSDAEQLLTDGYDLVMKSWNSATTSSKYDAKGANSLPVFDFNREVYDNCGFSDAPASIEAANASYYYDDNTTIAWTGQTVDTTVEVATTACTRAYVEASGGSSPVAGSGAWFLATKVGNTARKFIWGYASGATMYSGTSDARVVCWPMNHIYFDDLSAAGIQLIDDIIAWLSPSAGSGTTHKTILTLDGNAHGIYTKTSTNLARVGPNAHELEIQPTAKRTLIGEDATASDDLNAVKAYYVNKSSWNFCVGIEIQSGTDLTDEVQVIFDGTNDADLTVYDPIEEIFHTVTGNPDTFVLSIGMAWYTDSPGLNMPVTVPRNAKLISVTNDVDSPGDTLVQVNILDDGSSIGTVDLNPGALYRYTEFETDVGAGSRMKLSPVTADPVSPNYGPEGVVFNFHFQGI